MANTKEKANGLLKEFKEFALKGNVVDMAVGVIIGAAFGNIVSSLVNDIFTPLIACIFGDMDFTGLKIVLRQGEESAVTLNYGNFLQIVINFAIVALCLFAVVKLMNQLKRKETPKPAEKPRLCPYCKSEIAKDATRCPHCTSVFDPVTATKK